MIVDPSSHTVPAVQGESGVANSPTRPQRTIQNVIKAVLPEVERTLVQAYAPELERYLWQPQYYADYRDHILFASLICGDSSRVVQDLVQQSGSVAEVRIRKGVQKHVAVAANQPHRYFLGHPDIHAVTFVQGPGADERYLVDSAAWQYLLNLSGADRNFYVTRGLRLCHRAFHFARRLEELEQSERRVCIIDISSEEKRQSSVREVAQWFTKTFHPWLEEVVSEWIESRSGEDSSKALFFRYRKGSFPTQEKLEADLLELWDPTYYLPPNHPTYRDKNRFMTIAEMRENPHDEALTNETNEVLAAIFAQRATPTPDLNTLAHSSEPTAPSDPPLP